MIAKLLFVYGSLLKPDNEFAVYLIANSHAYSAGKFRGELYDVGEYPGAIINAESTEEVIGTIYRLNNPDEALKALDDYEGFGADQNQPNLFIRRLLKVETLKGPVNCWVYLYNLPVKGLKQIIPGDYTAYLAKNSFK